MYVYVCIICRYVETPTTRGCRWISLIGTSPTLRIYHEFMTVFQRENDDPPMEVGVLAPTLCPGSLDFLNFFGLSWNFLDVLANRLTSPGLIWKKRSLHDLISWIWNLPILFIWNQLGKASNTIPPTHCLKKAVENQHLSTPFKHFMFMSYDSYVL